MAVFGIDFDLLVLIFKYLSRGDHDGRSSGDLCVSVLHALPEECPVWISHRGQPAFIFVFLCPGPGRHRFPDFAAGLCLCLLIRYFAQRSSNSLAHRGNTLLNSFGFPPFPAAGRPAAFLAVFLVATGAAYVSVNYAKFGTLLNATPYQYQIQYDAKRLAWIHGTMVHPENIPFSLAAHFGLDRIGFRESFPLFSLISKGPSPASLARMDAVEPYASIPDAMPALALLCLLGIAFCGSEKGWPEMGDYTIAVSAFLGGGTAFAFAYLSYRYFHDLYPFLVIPAVLGMGAVQSVSKKPLRWGLRCLVIVLGIWSIAANVAFALSWQPEGFWADPAAKAAFLRFRGRVDSLLPIGELGKPIRYHVGEDLPYFRKGQLLTVVDPPATYRYDGRQWQYLGGSPLHLFNLSVRFPVEQPGKHMAMWFAGRPGACDAIYIVYSDLTRITFCSDHWGNGGVCGPPAEIGRTANIHSAYMRTG